MDEKIDELYQKYLFEKLDLIFNGKGGITISFRESANENYVGKYEKVYKNCGPQVFYYSLGKIGYHYADKYFYDGWAIVARYKSSLTDSRYNFVDTEGHLISDEWFDMVYRFEAGYAVVYKDKKFNLIDTSGHIVSEEWFDEIKVFYGGYARVMMRDNGYKYNFIDHNGKLISDKWYDYAEEFRDGRALVRETKDKKENRYNFINGQGKLICDTWYDYTFSFDYGVTIVEKDGKWNVMNTNSEMISKWTVKKPRIKKISRNFIKIDDKLHCLSYDLGDYNYKRMIIGYQCIGPNNSFKILSKPIKIYGSSFAICLDKQELYIFNIKRNSYRKLGLMEDIEFDDNFIFDNKNKKVYLVYEEQIVDITKYYYQNIIGKKEITISSGVKDILSRDSFFFKNEEEIKEFWKKEEKKNAKIREEQEIKAQEQRAIDMKNKAEQEAIDDINEQEEILNSIQGQVARLDELQKKTGKVIKIKFKNVIIDVDDHKEINPLYIKLGLLKNIDFSIVDLKNVKMSGIDFRGCNIMFDPQIVYNKDLSNSNFEGLHIDTFMNFTGVDIRGSKFSSDNDPRTVDWANATFSQAVYDENTTYNGNSFVELYGECKKRRK